MSKYNDYIKIIIRNDNQSVKVITKDLNNIKFAEFVRYLKLLDDQYLSYVDVDIFSNGRLLHLTSYEEV